MHWTVSTCCRSPWHRCPVYTFVVYFITGRLLRLNSTTLIQERRQENSQGRGKTKKKTRPKNSTVKLLSLLKIGGIKTEGPPPPPAARLLPMPILLSRNEFDT